MFLIFGGDRFYAAGGGNDFDSLHTDKDSAIERCKNSVDVMDNTGNDEWSHVFDTEKGEVIFRYGIPPYC